MENTRKKIRIIIQIPCYNEEEQLAQTVAALPRTLTGVDQIEYLIIDDGSTDRTIDVARQAGVAHIVRLPKHQGLARAFMAGIEAALQLEADIIVNTDADNQYQADDIAKLVAPILAGQAEIVIGERPISDISHFSASKKFFQRLGSWLVRQTSHTLVADAPSGFRAFSREAAMQLNVFNNYTYTLETIIQAGQKDMAVVSVPIRTNEDVRPSRLVQSPANYIWRSLVTIIRIFITYRPFRFFLTVGLISFGLGLIISLRFVWFYFGGQGYGHIQSLILATLLLGSGFFLSVTGVLADIISVNRKLLEKMDWRLRHLQAKINKKPDA